MFSRRCRLTVLLAIACTSAAPATYRAAPHVIILHGGILASPVYVTDRRETAAFDLTESASVAPRDLAGRPHFDAALFWGIQWAGYARDSLRVRTLDPARAEQHGRIYTPRRMAEAPVFVFRKGAPDARSIRRLSPRAVRVLQRHGIAVAPLSAER